MTPRTQSALEPVGGIGYVLRAARLRMISQGAGEVRERRLMNDLIIAGRYVLKRQLGRGGMGSVWEAEHIALRSKIAVKLIDPVLATSADAQSRFMREAQAAASLRSPHVVQILDYGIDREQPYIAMELLEGETLAARIERLGRLSPRETARIVTHVARAVGKAHEAGIVHRDLKPDNVFLVHNDEEEIAKVLDFGVAKTTREFGAGAGSGTRTGALLGTPYYMSPNKPKAPERWIIAPISGPCPSSPSSA